ncbi:hypothetical protein ANOM_011126 [Aspergillus nomiae NRRL 13137]|uniref:Uncharacterized protein n=1 Tax=Aspergillus nomiae NRRL (strain ATCC 15546 / NRRL 13137 / CBS 260.88 / M93) TaxID=1509407 RepID=A0A0L1IM94_ASPN3|nr:uncharacterized protein ANOM_011126 [Aspergillus nomiae NRRL 13137]KNG80395.1 hypothetical protein ANOM_011126 [Aspergillus nomiae NRRL 13137]
MAPRDIFLVSIRRTTNIRAHFATWVPSASDPEKGRLIEFVGTPMEGFKHQFRRGHAPTPISKKGDLETTACQVPAPRASENFMAPVNDTTNKRCQEWIMEYVRLLVDKGYIDAEAIDVANSNRDPPTHGIGLRPVASRSGN